MQRAFPVVLAFLLSLFLTLTARASVSVERLAEESNWLHLLHYHKTGMVPLGGSQVDDARFFLSETGAHDPLAEMQASLAAFRLPDSGTGDHAGCQFPARFHWLKQRLPGEGLVRPQCPELDAWLKTIDGVGLSLVFPAAYLNSPSSMFGHTLFRVQRRGGGNPLLDYAVNYAANADPDDNQLIFSIKGLSGGYPGVFTIVPYYDKIKEYSFLDSRDVWEYDLRLTEAEVTQFLRHVWELKELEVDYYFFTENCSYQLLTLLDAASERFDYTRHFRVRAIPADTVRVLVEDDLVADTRYRPSQMTSLSQQLEQLSPEERLAVVTAVEDPQWQAEDLSGLREDRQSAVLEVAYAYARYLSAKLKRSEPHLGQRTIRLLSLRASMSTPASFAAVDVPAVRDDQGHETLRLESGFGRQRGENYLQLGIRAAYHDLLDPPSGYPPGSQLEMFQLLFRQGLGTSHSAQFEALRFIDIRSYTPVNALVKPVSWGVGFGLDRDAEDRELGAYLEGQGGRTWALAPGLSAQALLDGRVWSSLDDQRVGAGPSLGLLRQGDDWSAHLQTQWLYGMAELDSWTGSTALGLTWNPLREIQLRLKNEYLEGEDETGWQHGLSIFWYL